LIDKSSLGDIEHELDEVRKTPEARARTEIERTLSAHALSRRGPLEPVAERQLRSPDAASRARRSAQALCTTRAQALTTLDEPMHTFRAPRSVKIDQQMTEVVA
jgi:hypothetical protein